MNILLFPKLLCNKPTFENCLNLINVLEDLFDGLRKRAYFVKRNE